jgi:hypothetical protein
MFSLWGGLGIIFRVRIQFGQACRQLICEFESPPLGCCCCCAGWWADCPLAAWGPHNDSCECLHVCFPQWGATLSYPLAIFSNSVWLPQRKGLKGLWEEEASWSSMHGRHTGLFITALPLQASCFLYQLLSCLSLSSFSWSLSSPSAGDQGLQEQVQGFTMGGHF